MSVALTSEIKHVSRRTLPSSLNRSIVAALDRIHEGRFQRSLCFVVGTTGIATGLEVGYEHYKGSYSSPVMYSPVILSGALSIAGFTGMFSKWAAQKLLRAVSIISLVDGIIGVGFHIRGIARKPGGWRLPVTNIVMGPPVFAPLLFGTSAYLGLMASYLRREDDVERPLIDTDRGSQDSTDLDHDWRTEISEGRFQKHLSAITIAWAFFSGFEALYSHYKSSFRYKVQWSPILMTPALMLTAAAAIKSRKAANRLLPAVSVLALANGAIGFYYHLRGIAQRPGGLKKVGYNVLYGPPIFAPLLFAACGVLGVLASLLRREMR